MAATLHQLQQSLRAKANPAKAKLYAGFFKTAPGEYGHGDIFLGITVPEQRQIAKQFYNLSFPDLQKLLNSKFHEERFSALVILIYQFQRGDEKTQKLIFNFYLKNSRRVNNWDLVDTSAPQIVGEYFVNEGRQTKTPPSVPPLIGEGNFKSLPPIRGEIQRGVSCVAPVLMKLAHSKNLWQRRIAMLASLAFIRHNQFQPTPTLAKLLLNDKHDLIHKAVGWMLREVGKRDLKILKHFLDEHAHEMPRTMLRYAIEKLSPAERKKYLNKK